MLSTSSLAALRVAATLTWSLPRTRARIRRGDRVLLEVADVGPAGGPGGTTAGPGCGGTLGQVPGAAPGAGPHVGLAGDGAPPASGGPRVVSPARFRCAVASAHRQHAAGQPLSLLGLPPGVQPAIDIGVPPGGATRPGGLHRVPLGDRSLWAFATTLDGEVAHEAGLDVVAAALPILGLTALGLRPDPATGVQLAYAETTAEAGSPDESAVVDLLEALLARWATVELLADVAPGAPDRRVP